jgi:hypothetical protein
MTISQVSTLVPLADIAVERSRILSIQRNDLVPLLQDQYRLNHYADHLIQSQAVLLNGVDSELTQKFSHTIEQLIQALAVSQQFLKKRRFNALQRWLGSDLEHISKQVEYYKKLDHLLAQADRLSRKLQIEIQKAQSRHQQLLGLREQMAQYIVAAEEFLQEYPKFVAPTVGIDHFAERLDKKIHTLRTLQNSNDLAIVQMQLTQQLSFTLLDRFKEAQQVLIPAWQHHVEQSQNAQSNANLARLDESREALIKTLKRSLQKPS